MEETHKMLKLLDHPRKSFGSHTGILLIKTGSLVNNVWFAVPYLDDVDVRQTSRLRSNVSQEPNRGIKVSRTTSTRVRNSSPDISQKGARSSKSVS